MGTRKVAIVVARCAKAASGFGIRFEQPSEGQWFATWAFGVTEGRANREGYDRSELSGTIKVHPSYPGCPHCATRALVRCGDCGKVSCWDGETRLVSCPWCQSQAQIEGMIRKLTTSIDV